MKEAMILMAHADDETLGAGGLIQKLVQTGWDVRVVLLTDGLLKVRGEVQDNRGDARRACEILGVGEPVLLGYEDQKFDMVPMADLANAVFGLGLDPDLIVTHVGTDLNLDHRIVLDVAKIVGRPKKKPVSILGCEIPSTSFWNATPFPANYFVDITGELETKIEAFSQYRNEFMEYPHPWSRKGLTLLAEYHGMQAGYAYAEAYQLIRGHAGLLP